LLTAGAPCVLAIRMQVFRPVEIGLGAHAPRMSENGSNSRGSSPVPKALPADQWVFGLSSAMQSVRERVEKVAGTDIPILIEGPGGTGKEVLARWIHERSPWRAGQFVKCNCAAIPGPLLESELFGYEKGAFTGAYRSKPGQVEMANSGTLFLDEVAELDLSLQAKLLNLMQDGRFSRIGDLEERHLKARMIFSANRDLSREAAAGRFRADLFYRINVIRIEMPPLKHRREDIPLLVEHFLSSFSQQFERNVPPISRETMRYLQERDWVGNIRELENCVARYVVLGSEEVLWVPPLEQPRGFAAEKKSTDGRVSLKHSAKRAVREMERTVILRVLQENRWNRRRTAQALNISYRALLYKIREARLLQKRTPSFRTPAIGSSENPPSSTE
jgi:two-component system, NtrC family, response regulator AtoC